MTGLMTTEGLEWPSGMPRAWAKASSVLLLHLEDAVLKTAAAGPITWPFAIFWCRKSQKSLQKDHGKFDRLPISCPMVISPRAGLKDQIAKGMALRAFFEGDPGWSHTAETACFTTWQKLTSQHYSVWKRWLTDLKIFKVSKRMA